MKKALLFILLACCFAGHGQQKYFMMVKTVTGCTDSIHIEAESYSSQGGATGVNTETTSDVGGGLNISYYDSGDWLEYNFTAACSGTYTIKARVATPNSGGSLVLQGGGGSPSLGSISVPNTGDWQIWQTITTTVTLSAGSQSIRFFLTDASINMNWIEIVK